VTVGFALIYFFSDQLRILRMPQLPDIIFPDVANKIFKKAQLHKTIRINTNRPAPHYTFGLIY
jgi:hypothetical protein